ncbi:MAG: sugar phosphate isomerase/epimerase [Prevotella sp.]|nr:sugar phosphate isomerase/epimerase [Prevotella sp.]
MTSRMLRTALLGMLLCVQALPLDAQDVPVRYRVAACDWMMLKRQKLGAFALAKEIGADGVELDMGPLGKRVLFENKLRDEAQASKFKHVADSLGIEVPSIAMSGFFAQNFMSRDNYRDLVSDGLETARRFGSKVIFLPLGGSGHEWKQKGAPRDTLVSRLRVAGTMAQAQGVTIGIRTQLPAKETLRLLKDIGSPAVKVYYNFQDAADNHRCIVKELKQLGRDRIIQIHASNTDSVNLREDPEIDLPKIKKTLDEMGWNGWLVVERSRDANRVRDVRYNFGRNVAYLKEVFGIP